MTDDEFVIEDAEEVEVVQHLPAVVTPASLSPFTMPSFSSPVEYLTWQRDQLQQAYDTLLVPDLHYGKIPGTGDKPTLLKPGADYLLKMFDLHPDPQIVESASTVDIRGGYVNFTIKCVVTDSSGRFVGSGFGSCSSEEARWQRAHCPSCGGGVWDNRKKKAEGKFTDSPDFTCKDRCGWGGDSPSQGFSPDLANTILKMAAKRAKVDACLTVTAAATFFGQDTEDKAGKVTHPAPQHRDEGYVDTQTVTHFDRSLGIRTLERQADGSWPKVCPYCTSAVEQKAGTNRNGNPYTMWKCRNRDCDGGEPNPKGGYWPWGSFHDDPWKPGGEVDDLVDAETLPRDDAGGFDPKAAMHLALAHLTNWDDDIKRRETINVITDLGYVVPLTEAQVLEVAAVVSATYYVGFPDERPF